MLGLRNSRSSLAVRTRLLSLQSFQEANNTATTSESFVRLLVCLSMEVGCCVRLSANPRIS